MGELGSSSKKEKKRKNVEFQVGLDGWNSLKRLKWGRKKKGIQNKETCIRTLLVLMTHRLAIICVLLFTGVSKIRNPFLLESYHTWIFFYLQCFLYLLFSIISRPCTIQLTAILFFALCPKEGIFSCLAVPELLLW